MITLTILTAILVSTIIGIGVTPILKLQQQSTYAISNPDGSLESVESLLPR